MAYALHLFVAGETVTAATLNQATYYNDSYLGGTDGKSGTVGVGPVGFATDTSAEQSTASATYVDITGATVTLTSKGGELLVTFSAPIGNTTAAGVTVVALQLDSNAEVEVGRVIPHYAGSLLYEQFCATYRFTGVAAGSHTIKARFKAVSGTAYSYAPRNLLVVEVRS